MISEDSDSGGFPDSRDKLARREGRLKDFGAISASVVSVTTVACAARNFCGNISNPEELLDELDRRSRERRDRSIHGDVGLKLEISLVLRAVTS